MTAFTNKEIYRLYLEKDSAIFSVLDTIQDKNYIWQIIYYFGDVNYETFKSFIRFLINYMYNDLRTI